VSSLTVQLLTQARVEALSIIVRRLVTDAVLSTPDPKRALKRLRSAGEAIADDANYAREAEALTSRKRPITTGAALMRLVGDIEDDVRFELGEPADGRRRVK
jgi:hypothetical protein